MNHAPAAPNAAPASAPSLDLEAPALAWDLGDLYSALDDPAIDQGLDEVMSRAQAFEARYRGQVATADAALLRAALDEYDAILRARTRPLAYASLMFSAETTDPDRGALLQRLRMRATAIAQHILFFSLELGTASPEHLATLAENDLLAEYAHYLRELSENARFQLTEPEEKIISELSNTGGPAFNRLASEITSRAVFRVQLPDGEHEMNQSELLSLLYDPDRATRQAASTALTVTLKQHSHVLNFIFNTVLQEEATSDRLRGYSYPEESRHRANELAPDVVASMVEVCVESFDIVQDWYRIKRELLGLESLDHADRYAPIQDEGDCIPYAQAQRIVLEAFEGFSPRMREACEPFFTRRWIDAEVRPGKQGGAYCSYVTPDLHPYVFMNYTERTRDVMTLAHELGHAFHGLLARDKRFLSFYPSLALAETASVFGEMLVFEKLQAGIDDPRQRLGLLAGKLEDSFSTVFRQASMYRFEQAAHRLRREHGEQTPEAYGALWQQTMQEMFGDALTLGDDHSWWWLYIPHIFSTPFYVYAYAFGELLVLSLYARYKQEGEPFVERYFALLAAGGSRSPEELLRDLDIDIRQKDFWRGGTALLREMVEQARALKAQC